MSSLPFCSLLLLSTSSQLGIPSLAISAASGASALALPVSFNNPLCLLVILSLVSLSLLSDSFLSSVVPSDFGLAVNEHMERPVTRLGTLDYMAPEVLVCPDKHHPGGNKDREDLWYTCSVDSWAVGVLAYELAIGRPPFGMVSSTVAG